MKYRKKPALTEATQWFKNGDHPQDRSVPIEMAGGSPGLSEGQVVRYFRSLNIPGGRFCSKCGNVMQKHGMLVSEHDAVVCPGDYVVTDQKGQRFYILSAGEFEAMYESYEMTPTPPPDLKEASA